MKSHVFKVNVYKIVLLTNRYLFHKLTFLIILNGRLFEIEDIDRELDISRATSEHFISRHLIRFVYVTFKKLQTKNSKIFMTI